MGSDLDGGSLAANTHRTSAAIYAKEQSIVRAKVSYLNFMSNYLSFAVRWRQCREQALDMPMADQPAYEQEHVYVQEKHDIVSVDSESSIDDRNIKATDLKSSSLLAFHVPQPTSKSDRMTTDPRQLNASCAMVDLTDSNVDDHKNGQTEEDRVYHDAIFEKARHLGMESAGLDDANKEDEAKADTKSRVYNIDSGSEGSIGEDDILLVGSAVADATNGNDDTDETGGEGEGEDDNDLDITKRERIELLRDEQNEYARFLDKLKASVQGSTAAPASNETSYSSMRTELQRELEVLRSRVRHNKRDASGVESDMVEDIRMLLTLFGIPYITAPMEAEAQCAELIARDLVDGMVTDDSDSFLFAPSSARPTLVYRHFFQKDKYVEMYSSDAIYKDSSLTQCDYVFLAYLMGSDYTVGIKGIGPVLAMEALAEFGPSADSSNSNTNTNTNSNSGSDSDFNSIPNSNGNVGRDSGEEQKVLGSLRMFKRWCDAVLDVLPGIELPAELA
ncbi:DNA repair protein rad2, partial [Coemansia erecta]